MTNLAVSVANTIPDIPKRGMPVTIITGFLGSGKTTLLNYILQNCQDLKVAVLVNEFGDINIDSQLLVSVDENMMELTNGCICCTINDGLLDAVYSVLERNDRIEYLIVETTGIADPLPIALTFLGTDLRDLTRLDAILTVVDVETFTEDHFESDAALNQIAYGDIILLNKTDLVPEKKVNELENFIRDVKAGARILRSQYGKVPLPLLLDVGFSQLELFAPAKELSHHSQHDQHHHHHSDHLTNDGFISVSFQSDRPFSLVRFQEFLDIYLSENIFRAKGIIWFQESSLRHIFQLSGKRIELKTDQWQQQRSNQLVFIGRNLNAAQLQAQLTNCLI